MSVYDSEVVAARAILLAHTPVEKNEKEKLSVLADLVALTMPSLDSLESSVRAEWQKNGPLREAVSEATTTAARANQRLSDLCRVLAQCSARGASDFALAQRLYESSDATFSDSFLAQGLALTSDAALDKK